MSLSVPNRAAQPAAAAVAAIAYPTSLQGRLAAVLDRWASGPRQASNRHWMLYMGLASFSVVALAWNSPDRLLLIRVVALMFFALHLIANRAIVSALGFLQDRGMPAAKRALAVYTGPGQLTSLDLGLMWVAVAVFAPLLDLVFPVAVSLAN